MKPTLVIMAAGIGSRYGGLKQIDPVGPSGELIIEYSVYDAIKAGFGSIIFVITEQIDPLFRGMIGNRIPRAIPVHYVHQRLDDLPDGRALTVTRSKPWGTAQAVYCCRNLIDGPFAVINADDFYGAEAFAAVCDFISSGEGADRGESADSGGGDSVSGVSDVSPGSGGDERADRGEGADSGSGDEDRGDVSDRDGVSDTCACSGRDSADGGVYRCCMAGYRIENTLTEYGHVARGVCTVTKDGYLTSVIERTSIERRNGAIVFTEGGDDITIPPGTTVSMSMWGFPGCIIKEFERQFRRFLDREDIDPAKTEFYLPSVVNGLLEQGVASVKVLKTNARWYGVTYREDKEHVKNSIAAMIKAGEYKEKLWTFGA